MLRGTDREGWWVAAIFLLSVVVAFVVPRGEEEGALPAVTAAAVVAYTGITWRLLRSAHRDRAEARERQRARDLSLMVAAEFDLRRYGARSHYRRGNALVLFDLSAASEFRQQLFGELPATIADAVQTASMRMWEFNELAGWMNAHTGTLSGGENKSADAAHTEAQEACTVAANALAAHIKTL